MSNLLPDPQTLLTGYDPDFVSLEAPAEVVDSVPRTDMGQVGVLGGTADPDGYFDDFTSHLEEYYRAFPGEGSEVSGGAPPFWDKAQGGSDWAALVITFSAEVSESDSDSDSNTGTGSEGQLEGILGYVSSFSEEPPASTGAGDSDGGDTCRGGEDDDSGDELADDITVFISPVQEQDIMLSRGVDATLEGVPWVGASGT